MSYLKPVIVTNCIETARIVEANNTGWVTEDKVEAVAEKIKQLCNTPDEVMKIKTKMEDARSRNLWISRAEKVIKDLEKV
jgi:glycosyltransferase involved in cell wall biosynthesis